MVPHLDTVVIVLVGVASQDEVNPRPAHLGKAVVDERPMPFVTQRRGELGGAADLLVKLADGQQAGIAGQVLLDRPDFVPF